MFSLSLYVVGYVSLSLFVSLGVGLGAGEPMIVRLLAGAGYRGAAIGVLDGMFLRWSVWCVFTPPVWSVSICSGRYCNCL